MARTRSPSALPAALFSLSVAACQPGPTIPTTPEPEEQQADYPGIPEAGRALVALANPCSFDPSTGRQVVVIGNGETVQATRSSSSTTC